MKKKLKSELEAELEKALDEIYRLKGVDASQRQTISELRDEKTALKSRLTGLLREVESLKTATYAFFHSNCMVLNEDRTRMARNPEDFHQLQVETRLSRNLDTMEAKFPAMKPTQDPHSRFIGWTLSALRTAQTNAKERSGQIRKAGRFV